MGPLASFSGLASGLDTSSLIQSMVRLEQAPIRRLEAKKVDIDSMSRRIQSIRTRASDVMGKLGELDTAEKVLSSGVTTSNEDKLKVAATGGAALGTYQVTVGRLAQAERTYSDTFADKNATGLFGTGTLSVQVGTEAAVDITVEATDTLEGIASKINAADLNASASVIYDGTNYRLQVSGTDTGAENAISFTETGTNFGLTDPANEIIQARDAEFTIDGLAMTRPTNSVVGAIAGVTLDLEQTTEVGESIAITVDRDPDVLVGKLEAFVESYNSLVGAINSEFAFKGAAKTGDSLAGDSTLRNFQQVLSRNATDLISGIDEDQPAGFAALGITTTRQGTLEIDKTKLTEVLDDNPQALVRALTGDEDAGVTGLFERLNTSLEAYAGPEDGLLTARIDSYGEQKRDIDDRIDGMSSRIDKFEETLRAKFTAMEVLVGGLQAQGQQMLGMLSGL